MKRLNQWMILSACAGILVACKNRNEKTGDKYLEAGDPLTALANYDMAAERGKTSKEFRDNYTKASIMAMEMRSQEDPMAPFIDDFKDSILSSLRQSPNPGNEAAFSKALLKVGEARMKMGGPDAEERGMRFVGLADSLPGKAPEVGGRAQALKSQYAEAQLADIRKDYEATLAGEAESGILADYKMNRLAQTLGSLPEMDSLWSGIRQANLSTYLMYDLEGLLPQVDARINKYGVLLGITKYTPSAGAVVLELKAFNGSSGPITFAGDRFTLVDKEGQAHKPASMRGGFSASKPVSKGAESPVGGLTFKLPAGARPDYVQFDLDPGHTRKYLP